MTKGQWLYDCRSRDNSSFRAWEIPGCLTHRYRPSDVSACLKGTRILVVGDSTSRDVFLALARKLDPHAEQGMNLLQRHQDIWFEAAGVQLEFTWDPFLNSSGLVEKLDGFKPRQAPTFEDIKDRPSLVMVGGGLWNARYLQPDAGLREFETSVGRMLDNTSWGTGKVGATDYSKDLFLVAPVQTPLYEALSPDRREVMTSARINPLNRYLRELSDEFRLPVLWAFDSLTKQDQNAFKTGGLHVVDAVSDWKADIMLNLRCNAFMSAHGKASFDGTCCSNYYTANAVEKYLLIFGIVFLLCFIVVTCRCKYNFGRTIDLLPERPAGLRGSRFLPPTNVMYALCTIGFALGYCFLADRTHALDKAPKRFSLLEFNTLVGIASILGALTVRRTKSQASSGDASPTFLPREQTDEWKGWMQFVVLTYHYTGASKSEALWIYQLVRLLVSAYLFMTGYGHTIYFLQSDARSFSFRRVATIIIRTSLLSVLLAYTMRTDYMFYYFAPLSVFWFIVVFLTLRIFPSWNESPLVVCFKIICSWSMVVPWYLFPWALRASFSPLRSTCNIHWDASEWEFRVKLDLHVVFFGMLAGVVHSHWKPVRIGRIPHLPSATQATVVILWYWWLASSCPDKYAYNTWHPFVSPFVVLSYAVLRNSTSFLRSRYSAAFAWLGRCSLETFTLQCHIWMAADTKGLLSLGGNDMLDRLPGGTRLLSFLVFTPLFLWISWQVAYATATVTGWMVETGLRSSRENQGLPISEKKIAGHNDSAPLTRQRRAWEWMKGDLRFRMAVILVPLWICNWVRMAAQLPIYCMLTLNHYRLIRGTKQMATNSSYCFVESLFHRSFNSYRIERPQKL